MTAYPYIPLDFEPISDETMIKRSESFFRRMKNRRTVRDYSPRQIPQSVIENAIRTAGTAPSGANMQPWHFVVVTQPETRTRIREAAEAEESEFYNRRASKQWLDALAPLGTNEHKPFLESASCLIAVFLKKFSYTETGDKLKNYYTAESVGIAAGILIAALHYAGVTMLTHTPSPMRFLNEILNRPKDERPYLLLVAGFPTHNATIPDISRYDLDDIMTSIT
jgi:nitroreductase